MSIRPAAPCPGRSPLMMAEALWRLTSWRRRIWTRTCGSHAVSCSLAL